MDELDPRWARILAEGGLVAFPTETVYGLGADATQPDAVRKIFARKGRPADHPLIMHLASVDELPRWAAEIPPAARRLADLLWPGPLTLVLPKTDAVPGVVTGGRDTVGLRVPAHPLALALLRALGRPIAAPSANVFGAVSPTTAAHVRADLPDVPVLDGGPSAVGLESTIVGFEGGVPVVLREGGVPREELEAILGAEVPIAGGPARAPGMLAAHYAPRARVLPTSPSELVRVARAAVDRNERTLVLARTAAPVSGVTLKKLPSDDRALAASLYALLREADAGGFDTLVVELPAATGIGAAVADRLRRAAAAR